MQTFVTEINHEVRTLNSAIIGWSEFMIKDEIGSLNEEQKEALTAINKSSKWLRNIFDEFYNLYHLANNKLDLYVEETDVNQLISQAILGIGEHWLMASKLGGPEFIEQNIPEDLPNIWIDGLRIQKAIVGILAEAISAIYHNEDESKVLLTVNSDKTWIKFHIVVNSKDAWYITDYNPRLFFGRSIVEKHGGRMRMEQREDVYPAITFTLPISENKPTSE